jgi:hypothetical protein
MMNNFYVPLDSILRSREWLESEFRFYRSGDREVQVVIDSIMSDIVHYSVQDCWYIWQGSVPFWERPEWVKVNGKRYDLETSCTLADDFLSFQVGPSNEAKVAFLNDIVQWLDRRIPKRNAFEVESPPSAGKNWFFDPILLYMGSIGQIANASRNNQFAFDSCFNKRVLLFNEPRFENSFQEQLLMLFAGDTFSAQGKYKNIADIGRTPVLVLTNSTPFPTTPKWNDRMFRYKWKRCEWLKDKQYKLDPRFFVSLLEKYYIE